MGGDRKVGKAGDLDAVALYAVAPARFVKERNRLATDLRRAGQVAESARIKAMPKPSVSVFAVNRAARRAPEAVRALFQATDQLKSAQVSGASPGSGGKGAYQRAAESVRVTIDRLVRGASVALVEAGISAAPAVLARAADNFRWGALATNTRRLIEKGTLDHDVDPPGFEVFAGKTFPRRPAHGRPVRTARPRSQSERSEPRGPVAARKPEPTTLIAQARRAAKARATDLRAALVKARRNESAARKNEARARSSRGAAEDRLSAASAELRRAERAVEAARAEYDGARQAVVAASDEIKRLEADFKGVQARS